MSLTVNTNMASLVAQRSLFGAGGTLANSMQRLSTGMRINSAADDAAGLGLSKKLSVQVSASDMAKNNVQTGINMVQTAESDLGMMQNNLQRMRDLAVQAANGVYSLNERKMISAEYTQLSTENDRIAKSSAFSDQSLLNAAITIDLQVGTNNVVANDRISITGVFKDFQGGQSLQPAAAAGISTVALAQPAIDAMSTAISTISSTRAAMGAIINRLQGSITRIDTRKENMTAARSVIEDTDVAKESAAMTKSSILKQSAVAMLTQANQQPQLALSLLR